MDVNTSWTVSDSSYILLAIKLVPNFKDPAQWGKRNIPLFVEFEVTFKCTFCSETCFLTAFMFFSETKSCLRTAMVNSPPWCVCAQISRRSPQDPLWSLQSFLFRGEVQENLAPLLLVWCFVASLQCYSHFAGAILQEVAGPMKTTPNETSVSKSEGLIIPEGEWEGGRKAGIGKNFYMGHFRFSQAWIC